MKTQAVVTVALLLGGVVPAQTPALQKADEKTLETVYAARSQAHDWMYEFWGELLRKGIDGDSKAGELANRIDDDRKRQHKWEVSAWTLSNSALRPGESISLEMGNGVVAVNGTAQTAISRGLPVPASAAKPDEKIVYMVTAPPEIRSRVFDGGVAR